MKVRFCWRYEPFFPPLRTALTCANGEEIFFSSRSMSLWVPWQVHLGMTGERLVIPPPPPRTQLRGGSGGEWVGGWVAGVLIFSVFGSFSQLPAELLLTNYSPTGVRNRSEPPQWLWRFTAWSCPSVLLFGITPYYLPFMPLLLPPELSKNERCPMSDSVAHSYLRSCLIGGALRPERAR